MRRKTAPPPTIQPDEGVRLLREQIARANALLANGVVDEDDLRNWRAATSQILADALGDDHELAGSARVAGTQRRIAKGDEEKRQMRRTRLQSVARALGPCIEHLEREIERRPKKEAPAIGMPREGSHDTVFVCRKGHLISDGGRSAPALLIKFCATCGAQAIGRCPSCQEPIRGKRLDGAAASHIPGPPAHCGNCGAPFPWTSARLEAVSALLAMSGAAEADQAALRDDLPGLAADSPETPVAVARWRKFLGGAGERMATDFKTALLDLATEAVKRSMFGA